MKWAQTIDGFIDVERSPESFGEPTWITGHLALRLVHKIRSEESAILVGTNTAEKDNPSLSVRHWPGKNPYRLVLDKKLRLPKSLDLLNGLQKTIVFNIQKNGDEGLTSFVKINAEKEILPQIMEELYKQKILSIIVEGGRQLLESFFFAGCWDEAHVFIGDTCFYDGIRAPQIKGKLVASEMLGNDQLKIFKNPFQK